MKNMIHVGNEPQNSATTLKAIAEALAMVLKAGAESHTEQETIRAAIKAVGDIAQVHSVNISNNSFIGSTVSDPAPLTESLETKSDDESEDI